MLIPFKIGKNSNGDDQYIDLSEIPLLMVSYSDEHILNEVFQKLQFLQYPYKGANYVITNSRRLKLWEARNVEDQIFLKDEPEQTNIHSRQKLFKKVIDEIVRREQILKSKKGMDFKRYYSLNLWNQEKFSYQFLMIDDIWDIVTAKPRGLGINLIRIMLFGPAVGIHTIFASGISYRNLLQQLVNINPAITDMLQEKYGVPEPKQIGVMGKEFIYTSDGLIFYRKNGFEELEKYYP
jgi:hypothetical protein